MSQNTNYANDEQKIEKIIIDSTEKFEAYDRFLNCTHKLVAELANINSAVSKLNTQIFITKRRQEMFQSKHKVLAEYGKSAYEQAPALLYMNPINFSPNVSIANIKHYYDPVTGYIRIEGEEYIPSTPSSLNYDDDDDEDSILTAHSATEASSLSQYDFINSVSVFNQTLTASRTQYPIRLAYALTIHKSQGQTLDKVVIGLGKSERSLGLAFVALSRVKNYKDFLVESHLQFFY